MCLGRGEPQLCAFEDGSHPPANPVTISNIDFLTLQSRVTEIERVISTYIPLAPPGPTDVYPPMSTSDQAQKTSDVERAARALEAMAAGGSAKKASDETAMNDGDAPVSFKMRDSRTETWPSIIDYSATTVRRRSSKWVRDMQEVVAAIPREELTMYMVDRFFSDSGKLCESISRRTELIPQGSASMSCCFDKNSLSSTQRFGLATSSLSIPAGSSSFSASSGG